jgi:hypothetical protein
VQFIIFYKFCATYMVAIREKHLEKVIKSDILEDQDKAFILSDILKLKDAGTAEILGVSETRAIRLIQQARNALQLGEGIFHKALENKPIIEERMKRKKILNAEWHARNKSATTH